MKRTFSLVLFCFAFGLISATPLKLGVRAPNLVGTEFVTGKRTQLFRMMTEMSFKKDAKGELVKDKEGKYINEFIRNIVVLNFFSRTCIPCLREMPTYNKLASSFENDSVKFIYVNIDPDITDEQLKKIVKNKDIIIPILMPNQKEAIRKYDASTLPRIVIINQQKKVSKIIKGFHDNLETEIKTHIANLL